jgi:hypothetical protein
MAPRSGKTYARHSPAEEASHRYQPREPCQIMLPNPTQLKSTFWRTLTVRPADAAQHPARSTTSECSRPYSTEEPFQTRLAKPKLGFLFEPGQGTRHGKRPSLLACQPVLVRFLFLLHLLGCALYRCTGFVLASFPSQHLSLIKRDRPLHPCHSLSTDKRGHSTDLHQRLPFLLEDSAFRTKRKGQR